MTIYLPSTVVGSSTTSSTTTNTFQHTAQAICKKHGLQTRLAAQAGNRIISYCWICYAEHLAEQFPVVTDEEPLIFEAAKKAWLNE